jgi:hypothetical protein
MNQQSLVPLSASMDDQPLSSLREEQKLDSSRISSVRYPKFKSQTIAICDLRSFGIEKAIIDQYRRCFDMSQSRFRLVT